MGGGDRDYFSSFGRSPQCTSIAQNNLSNPNPFKECNNASGTLLSPEHYLPAGARELKTGQDVNWCGDCRCVDVKEVRVLYFPLEEHRDCPQGNLATYLPPTFAHASFKLPKRANSLIGDKSGIAVIDGYTLYVLRR